MNAHMVKSIFLAIRCTKPKDIQKKSPEINMKKLRYIITFFCKMKSKISLTLSLPRSSIDDLVFSVFPSNFFKLSYKLVY